MLELNKIIQGDCLEEMKKLEDNSVDAIVTDSPYGLEFMGKDWDKFKTGKDNIETEKKNPYYRSNIRFRIKGNETGIAFQEFCYLWAKECLRVLKPGGFLLSFGGTRTYHRMVCGIEDAGFEIRDMISWLYGSGFPKSLNIGKQVDKMNGKTTEEFIAMGKYLKEKRGEISQNQISKFFPSKTGGLTGCVSNWELGMNVPTKEQWIVLKRELKLDDKFDYLIDRIEAEREITGINKVYEYKMGKQKEEHLFSGIGSKEKGKYITKPNLPEAKEWEGWGTALKPACEPIVVARKPLSEKNVALNVLKWGTGGININACRVGNEQIEKGRVNRQECESNSFGDKLMGTEKQMQQGRFPANLILDEEAGKLLDEQSGNCGGGNHTYRRPKPKGRAGQIYGAYEQSEQGKSIGFKDKGGASRFFYCAKASKKERNLGCEDMEAKEQKITNQYEMPREDGSIREIPPPRKNNHPTVKPLSLIQYLIKLVSKVGAVVLDPFLGSGTTAIACVKLNRQFIGIEKEEEYCKIAEARIKPFLEQETLK